MPNHAGISISFIFGIMASDGVHKWSQHNQILLIFSINFIIDIDRFHDNNYSSTESLFLQNITRTDKMFSLNKSTRFRNFCVMIVAFWPHNLQSTSTIEWHPYKFVSTDTLKTTAATESRLEFTEVPCSQTFLLVFHHFDKLENPNCSRLAMNIERIRNF